MSRYFLHSAIDLLNCVEFDFKMECQAQGDDCSHSPLEFEILLPGLWELKDSVFLVVRLARALT